MLDGIDTQILNIIQLNSKISNAEIARQVGMAPSAVLERVRRLETSGAILQYEARLNPKVAGLDLLAFIFVSSTDRLNDQYTAQLLADLPEVQEVHHVTGEDCFLVKVRVADPESLGRLLREKFGAISSIRSTRTTVVLSTVKETSYIPLGTLDMEVSHD
jgi:Lrp/AsnC family leucine-responsive transcriptional regulator